MTVNTASSMAEIRLDMMELKLDRLIDEMRFLKSRTFAFDTRLRGIEAYLEQQPESKPTPWFAAAASATARTALFAVGAAVGADQALSGSMTRVLTVPGPPGAASRDAKEHRPTGRAGLIRIGEEDS